VIRILGRVVLALLVSLCALYAGDWTVWRIRVAHGGGMGTVSVGTLIETPLKGNKEEYDWGGTAEVDCSRSLFPHTGSGACWWLRRHPVLTE
jgi:hypothetical protein